MPRFEDLAAEGQALVEVGGEVVGVDVATQAELDGHATDTTDVHGIADTSLLETTAGAQAKADAAEAAANTYTDNATSDVVVQMYPAVSLSGPAADDFGNAAPSLSFPDGSTNRSYGLAVLPDSWATFDVVALFGDEAGTAGNAVFRTRTQDLADNTTVALVDRGQTVVPALGVANQKQEITLASGIVHTAGRHHTIRVEREGADAADTFAAAMLMVGRLVILRKTS